MLSPERPALAHTEAVNEIQQRKLGEDSMGITKEERAGCSMHLADDCKSVIILDQTQLPNRTEYLTLKTAEDIYNAIKILAVRGAPAIGICAGYGMFVLADQKKDLDYETFAKEMHGNGEYLISSRPTAVNLSWAIRRVLKLVDESTDVNKIIERLHDEAINIHNEDIEMCYKVSEYGLSLIKDGDGILTHCNTGPMATSKYGTAIGPVLLGKERGREFHVFADETRPLLQGARLTAFELQKAGVDVTLICDNMASLVMKNG